MTDIKPRSLIFEPPKRIKSNVFKGHYLPILVAFLALMLDLPFTACLEPLLPLMLYRNMYDESQAATTLPADLPTEIRNLIYLQSGMVFGVKPAFELVVSPFIGIMVQKFGHKWPLIVGNFFCCGAALGFALETSTRVIMCMRAIQGLGSSLATVSGLALLADVFPADNHRSVADGIANVGITVGIIAGFGVGSFLYHFSSMAPFLIVCVISLTCACLRLIVIDPELPYREELEVGECSQMCSVLNDRYVLLALGAHLTIHMGLGVTFSTEVPWLMNSFQANNWEIGFILVICGGAQLLVQILVIQLSGSFVPRWGFVTGGLALSGFALLWYPSIRTTWELVIPESLCRAGWSSVTTVTIPIVAYLVDIRHKAQHGIVYGLLITSTNIGLLLGPISGSFLLQFITFSQLYRIIGVLVIIYAIVSLRLRGMALNFTDSVAEQYEKRHLLETLKGDSKFSTLDKGIEDDMKQHLNREDRPTNKKKRTKKKSGDDKKRKFKKKASK